MSSFRARLEEVERRLLYGGRRDALLNCLTMVMRVDGRDPEAIEQMRQQVEAIDRKYPGTLLPELALAILGSPGDEQAEEGDE